VDSLLKVRGLIPEEKVVLFPVTDNTVMALGKNWHRLADHYLLSWASCRERIEQVVLKSNLPALCSTAGVDYPGTSIIRADKDIDDCLAKLPLPILLKPEKQTFSFKTRRCDTQEEFRKFVRSEVGDWPLIAQEWIEGSERELYFYSCFMRDGVEHFGFTGRKVRTSPKGVGIATVIETCDEVQVRDAARKLLPVLNICGPVAMEFKKDQVG